MICVLVVAARNINYAAVSKTGDNTNEVDINVGCKFEAGYKGDGEKTRRT